MEIINLNGATCVRWRDFVNADTGTEITNATVSGVVRDLDLVQITTFTLTYSTANSWYSGFFSSTGFVEGQEYLIDITAQAGSVSGFRRHRATALYDNFD